MSPVKNILSRLPEWKSLFQHHDSDSYLYQLDHAFLNCTNGPETMWMNMGYWAESVFPMACKALLEEVLKSSGLMRLDGSVSTFAESHQLKLIDLGFGCGDQTIYLTQLRKATTTALDDASAGERLHEDLGVFQPLFESYIGVTLARSQFIFAKERIFAQEKPGTVDIQLFCGDAARPEAWGNDLKQATKLHALEEQDASGTPKRASWVLALDSLYHFSPSREPILHHAYEKLGASIMGFDLLAQEKRSLLNSIFLRIIARLISIPFSNFLTMEEYEAQLVAAGYEIDQIKIRDISEHVFSGISAFIEMRDLQLRTMGMNIGRYKIAGKIFKWWARSGVVRGCIVIAKK